MSEELTTSTSSSVPAHISGTAGGFIEDDKDLLSPPIIKLIQKTSEEFDQDLAKAGEYFNSATQEASSQLIFVPMATKLEYVSFTEDGELALKTDDEEKAKLELGEDYWKYKNMSFVILPYAATSPAIINFKGTSYKAGTKLYQLAKAANPKCLFSRAYKLSSMERQGPAGKYFVSTVSVATNVAGYTDEKGFLTKEAYDVAIDCAE